MLDSEILADVYLELLGGRQTNLGLATESTNVAIQQDNGMLVMRDNAKQRPEALSDRLDEEILARHAAFMASIKNAVWSDYIEDKLNS